MNRIFPITLLMVFSVSAFKAYTSPQGQAVILDDEELAKKGDAEAQYYLGVTYLASTEIERYEERALYWFNLSAKQGHTMAQYNLATMYYTGRGVPENLVLAYAWMDLASLSYPFFAKIRDGFAIYMSSPDIITAKQVAYELSLEIKQITQELSQDDETPS